jgi:hypothetical protein
MADLEGDLRDNISEMDTNIIICGVRCGGPRTDRDEFERDGSLVE